jgi:hypothetical protein
LQQALRFARMPTQELSSITAIALTVRICSIGIAISSFELLICPSVLADSSLLSWHVSRLDHSWLIKTPCAALLNKILGYPTVIILIITRTVIAILQLVGPQYMILHPAVVWPAGLLSLVLPVRSRFGLNAADQIAILVFGGLALVDICPTAPVRDAYLWFLSAQCCLSYSVAGIAKLVSPGWRNGSNLTQIMNIRTYSFPVVSRLAINHRYLILIASWVVICGESLFPFILIAPMHIVLGILLTGICFHVSLAILMGLNDFVWSFCSLYPALLFCLSRHW